MKARIGGTVVFFLPDTLQSVVKELRHMDHGLPGKRLL